MKLSWTGSQVTRNHRKIKQKKWHFVWHQLCQAKTKRKVIDGNNGEKHVLTSWKLLHLLKSNIKMVQIVYDTTLCRPHSSKIYNPNIYHVKWNITSIALCIIFILHIILYMSSNWSCNATCVAPAHSTQNQMTSNHVWL